MARIDVDAVNAAVEQWTNFRNDWKAKAGEPNQGDIQMFIEAANAISRELRSALGNPPSGYIESLAELAMHTFSLDG